MTLAGGYASLPMPAVAQAQSNIAEIIVYGTDPCPRSTEDQVVVCARRPEAERYRIPPNMRPSGTPQQMESGAVRRIAFDGRRDWYQQLLSGRTGGLHRLPHQGH